jgi:hypothetical protein
MREWSTGMHEESARNARVVNKECTSGQQGMHEWSTGMHECSTGMHGIGLRPSKHVRGDGALYIMSKQMIMELYIMSKQMIMDAMLGFETYNARAWSTSGN